jgi:hypothetical protein
MQITQIWILCEIIAGMGNPKYAERILSQYHFTHYEFHIDHTRPE